MIISKPEDMHEEEAKAYITYLQKKYQKKIKTIAIIVDDDDVELTFEFEPQKFERIRRITGYLVGSLDSWNNGKLAEEHDRVKHGMGEI